MEYHLKDKKYLCKAVLLTIAAFVMYKVCNRLLPTLPDRILDDFVVQVNLLVWSVVAALLMKKLHILKFSKKGFTAGCIAGWYIWLEGLEKIGQWIYGLITGTTDVSIPATSIIIFLIFCLLIGVSEELLFRGVLLEGCLDYFGNGSAKSLRKAMIVAGCIFGAFHLFNFIHGADPVYGILMTLNNMADGVLFCAVYILSDRNIWPCILIHALKDCGVYLSEGILCATTSAAVETAPSQVPASILVRIAILIFLTIAVTYYITKDDRLAPFINAENAEKAEGRAAEEEKAEEKTKEKKTDEVASTAEEKAKNE